MTVRSAALLVRGKNDGMLWLLLETWVWGALMALLVRWRAPGARDVRDHWVFPGLLASAGMLAISLLTHLDDFFIDAMVFVVPLIATAWTLTSRPAKAYPT